MWLEATIGSAGIKGDGSKRVWGREWLRVGWGQDTKEFENIMLIVGETHMSVFAQNWFWATNPARWKQSTRLN